jgi:hypothetical protein
MLYNSSIQNATQHTHTQYDTHNPFSYSHFIIYWHHEEPKCSHASIRKRAKSWKILLAGMTDMMVTHYHFYCYWHSAIAFAQQSIYNDCDFLCFCVLFMQHADNFQKVKFLQLWFTFELSTCFLLLYWLLSFFVECQKVMCIYLRIILITSVKSIPNLEMRVTKKCDRYSIILAGTLIFGWMNAKDG